MWVLLAVIMLLFHKFQSINVAKENLNCSLSCHTALDTCLIEVGHFFKHTHTHICPMLLPKEFPRRLSAIPLLFHPQAALMQALAFNCQSKPLIKWRLAHISFVVAILINEGTFNKVFPKYSIIFVFITNVGYLGLSSNPGTL